MREPEDLKTYYLVIARDTNAYGVVRCVLCGEKADDVHEILPRSRFGPSRRDELFRIENRVCLCRLCHNKVHNDRGRCILLMTLERMYGYTYTGEAKCILDSCKESQ